ncbi:MAG: hypothetical protein ACP5TZ_04890 [Nitrososphaeria archaeon]
MKASKVMVLEYIAMMGVPLLLIISVIIIPFHGIEYARYALMVLVAIGSIVYGAIGIKDVYVKGERRDGRSK